MSLAACAEIVRRGDPDRFLAAMAAPTKARAALFPIYAINVEVARAPWVSGEPMISRMRLQWWADALAEMVDGKPARRHEVLTPLADVLDPEAVLILQKLVTARQWDIGRQPFADQAQLTQYLMDTSGGLMWVAARSIGAHGEGRAIRDTGYASGLASWLRAFADLKARGVQPLPDDSDAAIVELAHDGLTVLKRAKRSVAPAARPATRAGWQAHRILRSAAANPAAVMGGRLHMSEFARRGSLLCRVMLRRP